MIPQQIRNRRREYDRKYRSLNPMQASGLRRDRMVVPADVQRVVLTFPCRRCGAAGDCGCAGRGWE